MTPKERAECALQDAGWEYSQTLVNAIESAISEAVKESEESIKERCCEDCKRKIFREG